MRFATIVTLCLVLAGADAAWAAEADAPPPSDCSGAIDFRLLGSWREEDDGARKDFLPSTHSQTADGRPVATEACMDAPADVEEVATVQVAPHMRSVTETHYHIGFIGLDRVLVTFPDGAMHFFRRIALLPKRAFDAIGHHHRDAPKP